MTSGSVRAIAAIRSPHPRSYAVTGFIVAPRSNSQSAMSVRCMYAAASRRPTPDWFCRWIFRGCVSSSDLARARRPAQTCTNNSLSWLDRGSCCCAWGDRSQASTLQICLNPARAYGDCPFGEEVRTAASKPASAANLQTTAVTSAPTPWRRYSASTPTLYIPATPADRRRLAEPTGRSPSQARKCQTRCGRHLAMAMAASCHSVPL
jgi:hypothetical protein